LSISINIRDANLSRGTVSSEVESRHLLDISTFTSSVVGCTVKLGFADPLIGIVVTMGPLLRSSMDSPDTVIFVPSKIDGILLGT
jgi:hypothetical protein